MRLLMVIFIFALPIAVSAQEVYNQTDEEGRKQGNWQKYHPGDTVLRYEGQFKDDQPYGKFTYYFPTGETMMELTYSNPDRCLARAYHQVGGELMAIGPYQKQEKDSTWTYYDFEGYKIAIEHYVNGKRYGHWKKFYPDGSLLEEKFFENDLEQGSLKQYHPNGNVSREATYVDGGIEGEAAFYHSNGTLRFEGKYYHDAKTGIWKTYDEKGELIDERKYIKGVPEPRDSDLIVDDTSKYYRKDKFTEDDVFQEDYMKIPSEEEMKMNKRRGRK